MLMDFLASGNAVAGLILSLAGIVSGVFIWLHRRMKAVATDVARDTGSNLVATNSRLKEIEADVMGVSEDVGRVREDLNLLSRRVGSVERTMETVAKQHDVAILGREFAELKGAMTSQMGMMSESVNTLYKAALRASEAKEKKT